MTKTDAVNALSAMQTVLCQSTDKDLTVSTLSLTWRPPGDRVISLTMREGSEEDAK